MQRLKREVRVGFESQDSCHKDHGGSPGAIPLSISIRRDDLMDAINEMAEGQFTIEEYLNEKAQFGPKIRIVD